MSLDNYMKKDIFSDVATIDTRRKKKIYVSLLDKQGDEVEFREVIDNLNRYITDQMKREDANPLKDEISPLVLQLFTGSLVYTTGHPDIAAFIASQDSLRYSIMHQMLLSFYFLKFVQKNELKIVTHEEDISDEEIGRIDRVNRANSLATMGGMMGLSPKEILKELLKTGQLEKEDIKGLLGEDNDDVREESVGGEGAVPPGDSKKSDPNSN